MPAFWHLMSYALKIIRKEFPYAGIISIPGQKSLFQVDRDILIEQEVDKSPANRSRLAGP